MNRNLIMSDQLDSLLEYKRALNATQEQIRISIAEKNTLQDIHEEFKNHYENLKKECEESGKRYIETMIERKRMEEEYEEQLKNIRELLEQREKVLDEQRTKALIPTDTTLLKAKIAREIESTYNHKIDELKNEVEKLETKLDEVKRSNALLKLEIQGNKDEHNRGLNNIKRKYQTEVEALSTELKMVQTENYDIKDRETVRTKNREVDEYKRILNETQRKINELRLQKDELKLEKNRNTINWRKEVEKLRGQNDNLQREIEEQDTEIQRLEKLLKKEVEIEEEKQDQIEQLIEHNDSLQKRLQDREAGLDDYITYRQSIEIEREYHTPQKITSTLSIQEAIKLRDDINKFQNELERSEKAKKDEYKTLTTQLAEIDNKNRVLKEEYRAGKNKVGNLQTILESLKTNKYEVGDNAEDIQRKCKEVSLRNEKLMTEKKHLELELNELEQKYHSVVEGNKNSEAEKEKIKEQLTGVMQQLNTSLKQLEQEANTHKQKALSYKNKVRQANMKLQQMSIKLSQTRAERITNEVYNSSNNELALT